MIVYIKTISVNYYITLRQLIRLLKLKRSIKPYLLICLFRKEVLQQSLPSTRRNKRWTTSRVFWRHRDLYNGITTNRAGYPSGHRYTPHTLQFSSYNKNKWTGYILEFCSPKDNNTEITPPSFDTSRVIGPSWPLWSAWASPLRTIKHVQ